VSHPSPERIVSAFLDYFASPPSPSLIQLSDHLYNSSPALPFEHGKKHGLASFPSPSLREVGHLGFQRSKSLRNRRFSLLSTMRTCPLSFHSPRRIEFLPSFRISASLLHALRALAGCGHFQEPIGLPFLVSSPPRRVPCRQTHFLHFCVLLRTVSSSLLSFPQNPQFF